MAPEPVAGPTAALVLATAPAPTSATPITTTAAWNTQAGVSTRPMRAAARRPGQVAVARLPAGRARKRPMSIGAHDRLGLDLDLPAGVEEAGDDDHRGGGADVGEHGVVRAADGVLIVGIHDVHARAHDVLRPGARLAQ